MYRIDLINWWVYNNKVIADIQQISPIYCYLHLPKYVASFPYTHNKKPEQYFTTGTSTPSQGQTDCKVWKMQWYVDLEEGEHRIQVQKMW